MRPTGVLVALLLALTAGCGHAQETPDEPSAGGSPLLPKPPALLEPAALRCLPPSEDMAAERADPEDVVRLGDDGKTLTISGAKLLFAAQTTYHAMMCVLRVTQASDAVVEQVKQTRALDGRQSTSYDRVTVSWSYNPDAGVSAVFTEK